MKHWQVSVAMLALCAFTQSAQGKETLAEAITRLYHPLASVDSDIRQDKRLSWGLREDLYLNQRATPGGVSPWLNNNLLCRCQDEEFISGELIDTTPLNAGRVHALLQLTLNQNHVGAHRLLGLTLVRNHSDNRWQVEDTDDGAETPKSLRAEIREDTRIKQTASASQPDTSPWRDISMIALLAQPEKYHLQRVNIIGVGNIEFEGNAVYLNKASWGNDVDGDSLWLDIDFPNSQISYSKAQQLNGEYVHITGTFDMDMSGHLGLRRGGITDITRYERVTTRKEWERIREKKIAEIKAAQEKSENKK